MGDDDTNAAVPELFQVSKDRTAPFTVERHFQKHVGRSRNTKFCQLTRCADPLVVGDLRTKIQPRIGGTQDRAKCRDGLRSA